MRFKSRRRTDCTKHEEVRVAADGRAPVPPIAMTASSTATVALQPLHLASSRPSPAAVSANKPILRTTNSMLEKRKRGADSEPSPQESSPTKRQKHVSFDLESNMTVDISNRSLEQTKREINKALDDRSMGDREGYDNLKAVFLNDRQRYLPPVAGEDDDCLEPQELVVYVVALSNCARLLDKSSSDLIKSVLGCSWLGRDDHFFKAYAQFLAALVSAQGSSLEMVLSMIVAKFKDYRPSTWNVPGLPEVDAETARSRLHAALGYVLRLFPVSRTAICSVLSRHFPYLEDSKRVHTVYVDNLLRLRTYAPDLHLDIMELIIDRLVKIDVQMQFDLDDMDDELTARIVHHINQRNPTLSEDGPEGAVKADDEGDDDSDADSVASDDSDFDEEAQLIETGAATIEKMDAIMCRLFDMYKPKFATPDSAEARACLEDMISDFANLILPTYRSRHTQFLVFHFSQYAPQLMDLFVGTLFNMAFETNRPMMLRESATAYLASYIARASRMQRGIVHNVVMLLCSHVDALVRNHSDGCRGPDLRRYRHLYCLVQALLYIFCFRWKELVTDTPDLVDREDDSSFVGRDMEWLPGFRESLSRVIHSKFNPLKVCSPEIVREFARLARHFRFLYVYPLLESNKRVHLAQFVTGDYSTGGALRDSARDPYDEDGLQLEAYFPFDPYQLPISKHFVGGDYLRWKTLKALENLEGEEGEEGINDDDALGELGEQGPDDESPGEESECEGVVVEDTATDDENDD